MTSDKSLPDPPPLTYQPNNTAPLPGYSRYNIEPSSLQQPRSVPEARYVPPAVPARVPQPYSQSAQQFDHQPVFVDWNNLPQPQPTVPGVQTEEELNPANLEAGQESKMKDKEDDSSFQRAEAVTAILLTIVMAFVLVFPVVLSTARGGTRKLILIPWAARLPYFVLVAFISRPRKSQTATNALRRTFVGKMICITLFHFFCGVGLAVLGGWIQYKFNAF